MENKQIKKATLCWKCKNADPIKDAGCSWSRAFQPVEGGTAERKHTAKGNGSADDVYETYCVTACPEYRKEDGGDVLCRSNEGCLRIAEHVLRLQMNKYRSAAVRQITKRQRSGTAEGGGTGTVYAVLCSTDDAQR